MQVRTTRAEPVGLEHGLQARCYGVSLRNGKVKSVLAAVTAEENCRPVEPQCPVDENSPAHGSLARGNERHLKCVAVRIGIKKVRREWIEDKGL